MASSTPNQEETKQESTTFRCANCHARSCAVFSPSKKQPHKCQICRCDESVHTVPVEMASRRKRNMTNRLGEWANPESATTAAATTAVDIVVDDNTNDSTFGDDDNSKRPNLKRARRSPAPPDGGANAGGGGGGSAELGRVPLASELVAEFIALPDKFNDDILAPLRETFGDELPGYASELYNEIVDHGNQLRYTRERLYSLAAVGLHGAGKSWQLNELAGAAVLPSADCADSVTTSVIRLRHASPSAAPPEVRPPLATFTVVLRLPTTAELVARLGVGGGGGGDKMRGFAATCRTEVIPNPFAGCDVAQMAELARDPAHFVAAFEAVRAGASVLVNNARAQSSQHVAIAQEALGPLRAIASAAAVPMDEHGASALDRCDCVVVGSFTREHADRAVQRTIELLCSSVGALASPLLYVIDVTSDSFAFASDFQLIDLPGVEDINDWPHLHTLAHEIAAKSSWLVVPHGSRYPAVDALVQFMNVLITENKFDALPEMPALVFTMVVASVADRQTFSSVLLLRASEAVSRFNAERSKSGSVDQYTAMFEDSVQILDRFPVKPAQRLPDAYDGTLEVFDRLRALRTQRTLSLMQMKVVNLCSVARVLAQQRRAAPDSAIAKLGNIRGYCKTMAKHLVDAWSCAANATIDAACKLRAVDNFERVVQDELVKEALAFWSRETYLLQGNVRMLCKRASATEKPVYLERTGADKLFDSDAADRADDDDDDNDNNDGDGDARSAIAALSIFVGEFCDRLEFDVAALAALAGLDGGVVSESADGSSESADGDVVDQKASVLYFAEVVGNHMHARVCELGKVLHQLGRDQVAVSQDTRKRLMKKIDEVIKPSIDKMRLYWNARKEKSEKLRQVEQERVYVKRLPRDMDVLPLTSQAADWTSDVERSRKGAKVVDGACGGAVLDSRVMVDELKLDDGSESVLALVRIRANGADNSADNRVVAELSTRARDCVRDYVHRLRPFAENDAFLVQSSMEASLWMPPVFVPISAAATTHSGARPMQRMRRGVVQKQDTIAHLTVLIVLFDEWQAVAKQLADVKDSAALLMILPESVKELHPHAHELALAFTRDVLSELVGSYVDFCLLPSVFGEFCELNAALNQLRPVSTAFGVHYMQSVVTEWRRHCANRLKACDEQKVSRLSDLICDLSEHAPVEPPVNVVSIDDIRTQPPPPVKGPLGDAMRRITRLAQLFTMVTDKGSIVAALRISARLDELVEISHADPSKAERARESRRLFVELFGVNLANAVGVWGVKTPHAAYCWSTFRMRGNALVHVQASSSGIVPILFSTLSVRRFSFFGLSNSIRDKPSVTYEVSLNSMARRLYESGRRNVLLKLVAWRQDTKLTADRSA